MKAKAPLTKDQVMAKVRQTHKKAIQEGIEAVSPQWADIKARLAKASIGEDKPLESKEIADIMQILMLTLSMLYKIVGEQDRTLDEVASYITGDGLEHG